METHFSILAGIIQWTGEPGRLQSMGLQRGCRSQGRLPGTPSNKDDALGVWLGHLGGEALPGFLEQAEVQCLEGTPAGPQPKEAKSQKERAPGLRLAASLRTDPILRRLLLFQGGFKI